MVEYITCWENGVNFTEPAGITELGSELPIVVSSISRIAAARLPGCIVLAQFYRSVE